MGYSVKHKMLTLHKVLPPENRPVNEVSRETGISVQTIYKWMKQAKDGTLKTGVPDETIPKEKSDLEKFSILLESRSIAEDKKGEWLRENGLHAEHLTVWEQERKEKALAEMAALYTLKKKAEEYWPENGDEK